MGFGKTRGCRPACGTWLKLLIFSAIVLLIFDGIEFLGQMFGFTPYYYLELFSVDRNLPAPGGNPGWVVVYWSITVFLLWILFMGVYRISGREQRRRSRDWFIDNLSPAWLVIYYRSRTSIRRTSQFVSSRLGGRAFYFVLLIASAILFVALQVIQEYLLTVQSYSLNLTLNVTNTTPSLDFFSVSHTGLNSTSSLSYLTNNVSQTYLSYNSSFPATPFPWINWGVILSFDELGKILGIFILLVLVIIVWRSRSTLIIEDFEDDTGNSDTGTGTTTTNSPGSGTKSPDPGTTGFASGDTRTSAASGIASLLLVEFNKINQLYCDVNEQRAIHSSVGDRRQVAAVLKVDDPGDLLNSAMSADSNISIGPIQIPVSAVSSVFNRIAGGPRIRGRLQKSKDGLLLVVSMSGTAQPYGWKVFVPDTEDPPDQGYWDSTDPHLTHSSVLQKKIEELACRIFTDIPATGSFKWKATHHFNRGLRKYRECLITSKDQVANLSEAEKEFMQALTLDNTFTAAWYNLGVVYLESGKTHAAEKAFLKAIEQDPNQAGIHHALALTRYNRYCTGRPISAEDGAAPDKSALKNGSEREKKFCTIETDILGPCWQAKFLDPEDAENLNLMALTFLELYKLNQKSESKLFRSLECGSAVCLEAAVRYQTRAMACAWRQFIRLNPYDNQTDYYAKRRWRETYSSLCQYLGQLGWIYLYREVNETRTPYRMWNRVSEKSRHLVRSAISLHEQSYGTSCCPELHWMSGVINLCRPGEGRCCLAYHDFRRAIGSGPAVMKYHASLALASRLQLSLASTDTPQVNPSYGFEKILPYALTAFEEKDEHRGDPWKEIGEMCSLLRELPSGTTNPGGGDQKEIILEIQKSFKGISNKSPKSSIPSDVVTCIDNSLTALCNNNGNPPGNRGEDILRLYGSFRKIEHTCADLGKDHTRNDMECCDQAAEWKNIFENCYRLLEPASDFTCEVKDFTKRLSDLECITETLYRTHQYLDVFNPFLPIKESEQSLVVDESLNDPVRKKIEENILFIGNKIWTDTELIRSDIRILQWIDGHKHVLEGRFEYLKASYDPWIVLTDLQSGANYATSMKSFSCACKKFSQFPEECVNMNLPARIARIEAALDDHDYYKAYFFNSFAHWQNPFSGYQNTAAALIYYTFDDYIRAQRYWKKSVLVGYGTKNFRKDTLSQYLKYSALSIMQSMRDSSDVNVQKKTLKNADNQLKDALRLLHDVYEKNASPDDPPSLGFNEKTAGYPETLEHRKNLATEYLNSIFALRYYIGWINYQRGLIEKDPGFFSVALSHFGAINKFYKPWNSDTDVPCNQLYEEYVITLFWIGKTYYQMKKYDEADKCFVKLITLKALTSPPCRARFFGFGFNVRYHPYSLIIRSHIMHLRILAERNVTISSSWESCIPRISCEINTEIEEFKNFISGKIKDTAIQEETDKEINAIRAEFCKVRGICALAAAAQQPADSECPYLDCQGAFTSLDRAKIFLCEAIELLPDPESYVLLLKTIRSMIPTDGDTSDSSKSEKDDLIRSAEGYCEALKNIGTSGVDTEDLESLGKFCKLYNIPVTFGEVKSETPKPSSFVCCVIPCPADPDRDGDGR
ncbi:tetratricopeptide repeat protein [Methanoregula sp.]|uniref:tetratricopeptide repeat protein n=1 Tax=Methanoregula sp. TaxID=2052170 RepID=UPI003C78DC02